MKLRTILLVAFVVLFTSSAAIAHPSHLSNVDGRLAAGFAHPWFGLDHLLAMVTVGLLSAQIGGRAIWAVPFSFLASMLFGGISGMTGFQIHLVEYGIAISVVVLGTGLAIGWKWPVLATAVLTGAFGFLHGHAHGTEMQTMAEPAMYAAGFLAATVILHIVGLIAGRFAIRSRKGEAQLRFSGTAIAIAGLIFFMGIL